MAGPEFRIDTLEGLTELFKIPRTGFPQPDEAFLLPGSLFCPSCGEIRKADVELLYERPEDGAPRYLHPLEGRTVQRVLPGEPRDPLVPALFRYTCRQCETEFIAVVHQGPDGRDLAVLPSRHGGLRTPHTPDGVAFYLDQALRAESVGARSAATAMYRGALEHLLFEQGYQEGMLGKKLRLLEDAIQEGTAPRWARDLDTDFLAVLKDLGNAAIHPNDGNVAQQETLDRELLAQVKETFAYLLFLVYEAPRKRAHSLGALQAKAAALKK